MWLEKQQAFEFLKQKAVSAPFVRSAGIGINDLRLNIDVPTGSSSRRIRCTDWSTPQS
jgi:hypothetical protein